MTDGALLAALNTLDGLTVEAGAGTNGEGFEIEADDHGTLDDVREAGREHGYEWHPTGRLVGVLLPESEVWTSPGGGRYHDSKHCCGDPAFSRNERKARENGRTACGSCVQ